MPPFTHLHVHTQYSMLDGAIRIGDLIEKTKEYGMNAVAVTDHGAMYGALEFYTKTKKVGIRPIIGRPTTSSTTRAWATTSTLSA